ncbi:MAG: hypothetical protein IPO92_12290 [Saprospiraceae bacterium]|nr:hypothetical protein [Saprospiraceae bacterium]
MCIFVMFNCILTFSQNITGKIVDKNSNQEQAALQMYLKNTDHLFFTNASGVFNIPNIKKGKYTLIANPNQNEIEVLTFDYNGKDLDLGRLEVFIPASAISGTEISTIDVSDLAGIENEDDNVSSALGASRDPFATAAAFNLGNGRFRPRGYFNEDSEMLLNGMPMNDQDDGRVLWTAWSGLNDVFRNQTQILNLNSNDYTFGGIGGATFVDLRASNQREGLKAVYSLSNRSYQHRFMLTKSTGLLKSGWAFSGAASYRFGNQGYVAGTHFQGISYFASVDKK